jgi:hypothetical protein
MLNMLLASNAMASIITSVTIQNELCNQQSSNTGDVDASVSAACGSDNVAASGSYDPTIFPGERFGRFRLSAIGSKSQNTGFGGVVGTASFEYPMMVTNTDQSGYMLLYYIHDPSDAIWKPGCIQSTSISIDGQERAGSQGIVSVPYIAGVSFSLAASATGSAISFREDCSRSFQVDLFIGLYRFVTQIPDDGESWYLYDIPEAQVVVLPEPAAWILAAAGLGIVAIFHVVRKVFGTWRWT